MSNQFPTRAFAALATVALLVAGTASADAHGMGGMGGLGMGHMSGPTTLNLTQIKTTNLSQTTKTDNLVRHDRRRFRFISVGASYVAPTCFYKHTIWGLAKICPDLDVVD